MDEDTKLVPTQAAITLANGMSVPAPVALDELTTKVVAALDMIAAIIPDLRKPHPATAKKVRGARTVPREAVVSIIAMVEASETLQRMKVLDTARAHEVLQSRDDFRVVAERLAILHGQVKYTIEERWAEVVRGAMRAFEIASALATDPTEGELAAHLVRVGGTQHPALSTQHSEPSTQHSAPAPARHGVQQSSMMISGSRRGCFAVQTSYLQRAPAASVGSVRAVQCAPRQVTFVTQPGATSIPSSPPPERVHQWITTGWRSLCPTS